MIRNRKHFWAVQIIIYIIHYSMNINTITFTLSPSYPGTRYPDTRYPDTRYLDTRYLDTRYPDSS